MSIRESATGMQTDTPFGFGLSGQLIAQYFTATAALDFPSTLTLAQADLTIAVVGAKVGDTVALGLPAVPSAGFVFNAFVSAADVVTVRATNCTAGTLDPASATYRVSVFQH